MGAVNTTYTFTPTDTITSTKMNNIIDETVMTSDAVLGGSGGSGGLDISSGKLSISANAINSSRLAANSVTSTNIVDGTIVNADISPTAAIAGTKIAASFGSQNITATGDINLSGTASAYTSAALNNTSGVETQVFANAALNGGIATVTNHPMLLITNNTERIRIESGGNVGIGTPTPGAKLEIKGSTVDDANPELKISGSSGHISTYVSLDTGNYNPIVLDQDKAIIFTEGTTETGNLVIAPHSSSVGGVRITSSGNVGIKKASPSTALDVNGTVTATAFAGPLTGNVTGNVTGSSGSCTGNSATATTAASCSGNSATATLATKASTLSNGGSNGNAMTFHYSGQGGQPTWVWGSNDTGGGNNNYVWNPANFSVNYANSAGTVSNGAITAAKLNGAQSGSAPIFGARAWVNFNGTSGSTAIRQAGNVSSVTRNALGRYTITFSTAMQDTNYAIVGFARDADNSGGNYFVSALSGDTKTTTQVQIEVNSTGGTVDSPEINLMIIR